MSNEHIASILQILGLNACDDQVEMFAIYQAAQPSLTPTELAKPLAKAQLRK